MQTRKTAFFTICSKNYIHFARVWAKSVAAHHPDVDIVLYLADEADGYLDLAAEPFAIVEARELCIPEFRYFCFRYDIVEFNTAIKPYCFSDLIVRGYRNIVYMDPDTRIYDRLDEVLKELQGGAPAVLTPHALSPNEHREPPNDFTFLQSGVYNLGFLAVRSTPKIRELMAWWERRLLRHCVANRLSDGLFVDQKWMDLLPAYCPGVAILRHPGYNVAYWNVDERAMRMFDGQVMVDDVSLKFFHYSGIVPGDRSVLSKHQKRLTVADLRDAMPLFERYHDDLDRNGRAVASQWPYAYGTFSNGEQIPKAARQLYREQLERYPDDPFSSSIAQLNEPAEITPNPNGVVTRLGHYVWRSRENLQATFPLADRPSQVRYARWFATKAARMPECLTAPVRRRLVAIGEPIEAGPIEAGLDKARAVKSRHGIARRMRKAARRVARFLQGALGRSARTQSVSDRGAALGAAVDASETREGVVIIGYPFGTLGIGEALRSLARSAVAAGIPTDVYDHKVWLRSAQNDRSIEHLVTGVLSRKVNVLSLNADILQRSMSILGPAALAGRYNIIRPFWELSSISPQWVPALEQVDEIWAPTTFVRDAFARSVGRPVIHMPVAVTVAPPDNPSRDSFGLPRDKFLFLFSFDFSSFSQRKNPDAAVEAFCRAFDSAHSEAALVVKTMGMSNDRTEVLARLLERVGDDPRVYFINKVLDRARAVELLAVCDAFVSLHRAEGFGLSIAEAMALGKPVIATDYSGSTDFLSEQTGYPVRYGLVPVGENEYPYYQPGQVWADPDIGHAADRMREIYENRHEAALVGQAARGFILANHSPFAVGTMMRERLQALGLLGKQLAEGG